MNTVLFACVHNAGRSQMAAAWFNLLSDPAKARALSAGTDPAPRVHPEVVTVMREAGGGLDIRFIRVRSKHENAPPVIVTHGWPGSIIEPLKIIDPLNAPNLQTPIGVGLGIWECVGAWDLELGI